jgi:hypothetical protein
MAVRLLLVFGLNKAICSSDNVNWGGTPSSSLLSISESGSSCCSSSPSSKSASSSTIAFGLAGIEDTAAECFSASGEVGTSRLALGLAGIEDTAAECFSANGEVGAFGGYGNLQETIHKLCKPLQAIGMHWKSLELKESHD